MMETSKTDKGFRSRITIQSGADMGKIAGEGYGQTSGASKYMACKDAIDRGFIGAGLAHARIDLEGSEADRARQEDALEGHAALKRGQAILQGRKEPAQSPIATPVKAYGGALDGMPPHQRARALVDGGYNYWASKPIPVTAKAIAKRLGMKGLLLSSTARAQGKEPEARRALERALELLGGDPAIHSLGRFKIVKPAAGKRPPAPDGATHYQQLPSARIYYRPSKLQEGGWAQQTVMNDPALGGATAGSWLFSYGGLPKDVLPIGTAFTPESIRATRPAEKTAYLERKAERDARINAAKANAAEIEKKLKGLKTKRAGKCPYCKTSISGGEGVADRRGRMAHRECLPKG